MSAREQPILFLSQFDFTDNFGGLFFVFLNVVSPVFILVVIGYFIGPRLNVEARSLSRTAYFVFVPAFVFNIISEAKIEAELALQMVSFIFATKNISGGEHFLVTTDWTAMTGHDPCYAYCTWGANGRDRKNKY